MSRATRSHTTATAKAAASAQSAAMDAWVAPIGLRKVSQEAARFWVHRLHAYADFVESAMESKTPSEWWNAYQTWVSGMRAAYSDEALIRSLKTPSI